MLSLRCPRWRAILSLPLSFPLLGRWCRHPHHPAKVARALQVEPLEDRLAPAAAPFFTHAPLPPALPPMLEQGLKMLFQLAQHENFRLMTEDLRKSSLGMSSHPFLSRASQTIDLSNHPILAALAASGDGSRWTDLGDGLLRTELSDRIASLPAVPLAQGFTTTTMILVHNESVNAANGLALSAGDFSSLPTRLPILAETLSSSPFNFQSPMTPGNDRSIVFELSPYAPAAPDIVPIPVPRGMDDWFAELFGAPSQGPGDALGASNDSSDAVREAVLQMLHEGGMPQRIGILPAIVPEGAGDGNLPAPFLETPLAQPTPEQPGRVAQATTRQLTRPVRQVGSEPRKLPRVKLMANSLLGLFAAGMGRAVWNQGRREPKGQARKDVSPMPSLFL